MNDDGTPEVKVTPTGVETTLDIKDSLVKTNKIVDEYDVPEEYRAKPWVQDLLKAEDPLVELFKMNENAQTLIGKKAEAPKLPDSPEGYVYTPPVVDGEDKQLWDELNKSRSATFLAAQKRIAHEEGLTPQQFQNQLEKVERAYIQEYKANRAEGQKKAEADKAAWEATTAKYLGNRKDEILTRRVDMLKAANVPAEVISGYESGDPGMRVVAEALMLDHVNRTYVKPDKFSQDGASSTGDRADLVARATALMQDPAYMNVMDAKHDRIKKQVDQMWKDAYR